MTAVDISAARVTHAHISNVDEIDALGHIVLDLLVFTDPSARIGLGDLDQTQSSVCSHGGLSMVERGRGSETCHGDKEAADTVEIHDRLD